MRTKQVDASEILRPIQLEIYDKELGHNNIYKIVCFF